MGRKHVTAALDRRDEASGNLIVVHARGQGIDRRLPSSASALAVCHAAFSFAFVESGCIDQRNYRAPHVTCAAGPFDSFGALPAGDACTQHFYCLESGIFKTLKQRP
jgi:hypothetical protein